MSRKNTIKNNGFLNSQEPLREYVYITVNL